MSEQGYNGWSNYPTWCVNLWLSNDEGLYNKTRDRLRIAINDVGRADLYGSAKSIAAIDLKALRDELAPDLGASFAADLLSYALGEVDWYEIAEAWLADLVEA